MAAYDLLPQVYEASVALFKGEWRPRRNHLLKNWPSFVRERQNFLNTELLTLGRVQALLPPLDKDAVRPGHAVYSMLSLMRAACIHSLDLLGLDSSSSSRLAAGGK